ncbi:MAG: ATPase, T2SS/T4P/T4SS family, partial [Candidatus Diapherotrites archaeon]|nr:ATPase, T2SS/T4P/T4SS family [Candidatus Diapherotrites archaeon]
VYDEHETKMLTEISALIRRFENDSLWSYAHLGTPTPECEPMFANRHDAIVRVTHDLLSYDPVMAYLTCLHELKTETEKLGAMGDQLRECNTVYLSTLTEIKKRFESTEMIANAKDLLQKLQKIPESREIYRTMFEAEIKPSFIGSRLLFGDDEELELLDDYSLGEANVQIFKHPNKTENLYFVNPPEYSLSPEKYFILTKTKEIVASYKPGKTSLSMVAKSRKYFERIYESTIHDIAQATKIPLSNDEARELAGIVARYTVGYGVLELVLQDKHLTDIYIDAPIGMKPIYVVHSEYGQCQTNIVYTNDEAESLISKLRAMSGRPFDEAHPVLDYDLADSDARVAVIGRPLSPDGNAFAFRLHKVTPWTLPQFVDNQFMTPLSAGLLSFFIDQQATMLVTGSRGAGKTSLLQSLMLEILQNTRIIVQEDSVTGDAQILVQQNGQMQYTTVGELIDGQIQAHGRIEMDSRELLGTNPENIHVYALNKKNEIGLVRVSQFSRHRVTKEILQVSTQSGKKIKVTKDHSLFGQTKTGNTVPVRTSELKVGQLIATCANMPDLEAHSRVLYQQTNAGIKEIKELQLTKAEIQLSLQWEKIASIEKVQGSDHFVYDFSVPKCENFICENILAHNTLELPIEYMKNIGFNIQSLKTRSPISVSKTESEVSPEESLRTALRLGDSALVLGEVRSIEAKVLYEAMRVGAAGNSVLGTIHGDSAYSVWDRVVNDLQVPTTSFKATDLVIVCRPIRFRGSLRRHRRLTQVTEVKKHWTVDPDKEGGLLDLMHYNAKDDRIDLLEDNLKESDLFERIQQTSGMGIDEIWKAIKTNAASKAFLVDLKNKHDLPELLEAENYCQSYNKYLILRENQLQERKKVDYDLLLSDWKDWTQNKLVKRLLEKKNK